MRRKNKKKGKFTATQKYQIAREALMCSVGELADHYKVGRASITNIKKNYSNKLYMEVDDALMRWLLEYTEEIGCETIEDYIRILINRDQMLAARGEETTADNTTHWSDK